MTRREILKLLSALIPASLIKLRDDDVFSNERVCVHVFNHEISIPKPLLQRPGDVPARKKPAHLFQIGIPELSLCTSAGSMLSSFRYFWPLTRDELRRAQERLTTLFERRELVGNEDVVRLKEFLSGRSFRRNDERTVLLVVLNDFTRYLIADILESWRQSLVDEAVVFKDPTQSPYLCDYAAIQKGFKRPPP